jgi:hypothetical protein
VQEDDLKLGKKPNLDSWGTESIEKKGSCTEIDGKIVQGKSHTTRELL